MKRIKFLLAALFLSFSLSALVSCGSDEPDGQEGKKPSYDQPETKTPLNYTADDASAD